MPGEFKRIGIKKNLVVATGAGLTSIVPAASGYITSITQLFVVNRGLNNNIVALHDGSDKLSPSVPIAASGTLIIDDFGGSQFEFTKSSGANLSLTFPGDFEVLTCYLQHDKRTPITKAAARTASYTNITVSRALG